MTTPLTDEWKQAHDEYVRSLPRFAPDQSTDPQMMIKRTLHDLPYPSREYVKFIRSEWPT